MASQKQLETWLNKAIERVAKYSSETKSLAKDLKVAKADPALALKIQKKLTKSEEALAEAEVAVAKYKQELTAFTPTKTKAAPKATVEKKPLATSSVNGWPAPMVKILDQWLTGRSSWNHDDWMGLLAQLSLAGFDNKIQQEAHLIGEYLEQNRS
jgi:hypothetical protein